MCALDAAAVLGVWEEGALHAPVQRAFTLLAAAQPDTPADDWREASVGQRDSMLLALREELFGPSMEAAACCPRCNEPIEIRLTTEELRIAAPPVADPLCIEFGSFRVEYRVPTCGDLVDIVQRQPADGREWLLRRCIQAVCRDGMPTDQTALPIDVVNAVTQGMADADPQADVQVALACPACGHRWSMMFDITSYLWDEIEDWVGRLLREIHALASAYGWSERDILAMSPRRRRLYLEMVGA